MKGEVELLEKDVKRFCLWDFLP